jgi:hypothetical protein
MGNYAFQAIVSRNLAQSGEYGLANSALSFTVLLGLPVSIASFAITHYIARFAFAGDDVRLHNLLAGCRQFLFRLTLVGSVLAIALVKPLSAFFQFPRSSLMLMVIVCVCAGLWGAFATALCQGLGWFKRLAFIGLLAMVLRLVFGVLVTRWEPTAEMVVAASIVGLLANLILLRWRKDLAEHPAHPESPWTREFAGFLVVSAACVGGGYCFLQGDLLVAKRYLASAELDGYAAAGLLARALPMTVGPLLTVLFTHRSGRREGHEAGEQLKLLGLYGGGLAVGATVLILVRELCLKIMARNTPEVAAMVTPLAVTMVFVGLLQGLGVWALASRWTRVTLAYGAVGLAYWLGLLAWGTSRAALLRLMPIAAGAAFAAVFVLWLATMRWAKGKEGGGNPKSEPSKSEGR